MDAITHKISENVCIRMIDFQNRVTIPAKMMNALNQNRQVYVAEPFDSNEIIITNNGSREDIIDDCGKGFHRSHINGSYTNYTDSKQYRVSLKTRIPEGKLAVVFRYDDVNNEIIGTPI